MKKIELSKIMKRAWVLKKENKKYIFGLCLKMAWAEREESTMIKEVNQEFCLNRDLKRFITFKTLDSKKVTAILKLDKKVYELNARVGFTINRQLVVKDAQQKIAVCLSYSDRKDIADFLYKNGEEELRDVVYSWTSEYAANWED